MTFYRENYQNFIKTICNNINNNEITDDILENIDSITDSLIEFSKYFDKLIEILMDNTKKHNDKVNELIKLSFRGSHLTREQAEDILKRMKTLRVESTKSYKGGSNSMTDILPSFKDTNLNKLGSFNGVNFSYNSDKNSPNSSMNKFNSFFSYYFFKIPLLYSLKLIRILSPSRIFNKIKVEDFSKDISFTYVLIVIFGFLLPLFLPILGILFIYVDFKTFFWAIDENRIYLALIIFISSILSLFTLRIIDLGFFFKILYIFDVYSSTENDNNLMKDELGFTQTTLVNKEELENNEDELIKKIMTILNKNTNNQELLEKYKNYIENKLKNDRDSIKGGNDDNINKSGVVYSNDADLPAEDTTAMSTEDKTAMPAEDTTAIPAEDTTAISAEDTTAMSTEDKTAMPAEDKTAISAKDTTAMPAEDKTAMSAEDETAMPAEDTTAISAEDTTAISAEDKTAIPAEDKTAMSAENNTTMKPDNSDITNDNINNYGVLYSNEDPTTIDPYNSDMSDDNINNSGVVYSNEDTTPMKTEDNTMSAKDTNKISTDQITNNNITSKDDISYEEIDKLLENNIELKNQLSYIINELDQLDNINKRTGGNKIIYKKKNKKKISKKHTSKRKNMRL